MKILGSQVTKTGGTPLTSGGDCLCCPALLRLSPSEWCAIPSGAASPFQGKTSDALGKQISIATHKLQLGCRIRQGDMEYSCCAGCHGCVDHWQMLMTEGPKTQEGINRDALQQEWLPEGLCPKEGALPWPSPAVWARCSNSMNKGTTTTPTTPQIREYRKNLSVRLGSLKWSLDLVMVVKSRSSVSKVCDNNKSSTKSSSRTCGGVFSADEKRGRPRTVTSYTNLVQLE